MTGNVDLDTLTNGFRALGAAASDGSGRSVSGAGDFNGDGYDDIIIGAPSADPNNKSSSGTIYILYGKEGIFSDIDLSSDLLSSNKGFKIFGAAAGDYTGGSVSAAGDINGDGYGDIIIGAYSADPDSGSAAGISYVIFGKPNMSQNINLVEDFATTGLGFAIYGEKSNDSSGGSVSGAGDFNGDGYDDIIIGASDANNYSGTSYILFGKATGFSNVKLSDDLLATNQGFKVFGSANNDNSGCSVSGAGDVNGDGYADVIIGADNAKGKGASYIIFGKASGFEDIDLSIDLTTTAQGFTVFGTATDDRSGSSVSGAGDVNGDGYAEIIIGAPWAEPYNQREKGTAGITYIIYGKSSGFSNIYLSSLSKSQGFAIYGAVSGDTSGSSVSGAGDMNNDGFADFIIGTPSADPDGFQSGTSYIIYGKNSAFSNIDLATTDLALTGQGFAVFGAATEDYSGGSVKNAGDFNHDGYADIIIGANSADPSTRDGAGISYIIYGEKSLMPTTSPTVSPTYSPTQKELKTSAPTAKPTHAPTSSPTEAYISIEITTGGTYTGTSAKEEFIVDSSQDTTITGGDGEDMYTIFVHPGVNTSVTDFNEINELINLSAFTNIHSMDDFTITSGSAIINLDNNQKVILQNLTPADLSESNFIFAPVSESDNNQDDSSVNSIMIGSVIAGTSLLCALGYLYYSYTKHIWPFSSSEKALDIEIKSTVFAGDAGIGNADNHA